LATTAYEPGGNEEETTTAWPLLNWTEPIVVVTPPPCEVAVKTTVPVGVPDPGATAPTVAVRVMACPKTDRFADEARITEAFALFTVSSCDDDWTLVKSLSPL
jgi:hypothetical protein